MQILKDEFPVWIVSTTEHCQRNHCNICQRNQPTSSQKIGQPWSVIGRQNQCPSTASLYQIPGRDKRWAGWDAKNSCYDLLLFPSYPNKPIISLGVKAPLVLSKGTTLQAVTNWRQFCSPQKIKLLMTMELLPSDISLTELQAWPNLHSRHVKALQWWQWQVINIDKKLHFKFFLINNSKVFAYFLSDHTFLVPHRESLVTEGLISVLREKVLLLTAHCTGVCWSQQVCPGPQHFLPAQTHWKTVCMCSGTLSSIRDVTLSLEVMLMWLWGF